VDGEAATPPEGKAVCDRCGGFASGLTALGDRNVCEACFARFAKEVRLYPHGYVVGIGTLANPVAAAVLMAINYSRLGDAKRRRTMIIAAVGLLLLVVGYVMLPFNPPSFVVLPVGLVISSVLARPYRETWRRLKAAGAGRANVLVPVAVVVAVVVGVVGLLVVTGTDAN
jgi:hypothetical protein